MASNNLPCSLGNFFLLRSKRKVQMSTSGISMFCAIFAIQISQQSVSFIPKTEFLFDSSALELGSLNNLTASGDGFPEVREARFYRGKFCQTRQTLFRYSQ